MRTNSLPHRTGYDLTLRLVTIALLMFGAITAARLSFAELVASGDTPESLVRAARLAPNAAYLERLSEHLSELSGGASDIEPDHVTKDDGNAGSAALQREERASDALRLALAINPRSSSAWITLGLAEERERDFPEAARDLEQAARVDRQYLPAWTLVNYYFRRADRPLFWKWARRAAALAYDDLAPLLTLADRLEPGRVIEHFLNPPQNGPGAWSEAGSSSAICSDASDPVRPLNPPHNGPGAPSEAGSTSANCSDAPDPVRPLNPPHNGPGAPSEAGSTSANCSDAPDPVRLAVNVARLERAYLDLLIGENRLDDAQRVARRMLERTRKEQGSAEDMLRLRGFATRLIAAKRGADALEIWSGISTGPTPAGGLEIRNLRREVE